MNDKARVVDTDVASFVFKGDSRAALYRPELEGYHLLLSFQTIAELWQWAEISRWGDRRCRQLENFLDIFTAVYSSSELCLSWSQVMVDTRRNGQPILCGDAWIAATACHFDVPLVSHNAGDYRGISNLRLITK